MAVSIYIHKFILLFKIKLKFTQAFEKSIRIKEKFIVL